MLNGNKVFLLGIKLIKLKMGVMGENYDLNELKIKEVDATTFMKAPFIYEGTTPVIEIVEEVRLHKNWFNGRKSYSVGIKVDRFDFKTLERRMAELASEGFPKESFKLIKKNKKGEDMIYCKATTDMSGKRQKVGCRVSGRKASYGEFGDLCKVGIFHARLETCLSYAFKGKTCGFTLEARNVVCEITS